MNTLTIQGANKLSPIGYFLHQILQSTTDWDVWIEVQDDARKMRKKNEFTKTCEFAQ